MLHMALVTIKGVVRDRIFHGIGVVALLFLLVPVVASLSMRQVEALSATLSLGLISFILLLLSLFLGGVSLWKDIDRRHTYTVLGLPLSRSNYLLGKFLGISLFMLLVVVVLFLFAATAIALSTGTVPPQRPLEWDLFFVAVLFDLLKYVLLVAFAFLFSTMSTSFFLPLFGTISIYLVGHATQEAYDFVQSEAGRTLSPLVQQAATAFYYVVPNFSAFDLKLNVVYGLPVKGNGLLLTLVYFVVYLGIVLSASVFVFNRRELK